MHLLPQAWWWSLLARSSSSHVLYEFQLSLKMNFNGLGNQFWDKRTGSSIYRVAEAFETTMDVDDDEDGTRPILAPFSRIASWTGGGMPWTLLFDLSGIPVLTSLQHRTFFSTNCTFARARLDDHQMPSDQGFCKEATPNAACRLLKSQTIVWIDERLLRCRKRRRRCSRSRDHAFLSPFFFDPVKQRQHGFDRAETLPFGHESAVLNPTLGMALRKLKFARLIRSVANDILQAVGCRLDSLGAVHVRRGDRNTSRWRDYFSRQYHLFDESCHDCRSCLYRCVPTNRDLDFLGDNFTNSNITVVWIATDDASLDSLVHHDPPFLSQRAPRLALVSRSSRFIAPIVQRHLREYTYHNEKVFLQGAIDLYFLTNADQAILDLYSTFSAIAMRKREADEKLFMVW